MKSIIPVRSTFSSGYVLYNIQSNKLESIQKAVVVKYSQLIASRICFLPDILEGGSVETVTEIVE